MAAKERRLGEVEELQGEVAEKLACPVCFQELGNIRLLNEHLDNDHGFDEPEGTSVGNGVKKNDKKHHKRERIVTSHFKTFTGSCKCHHCEKRLKKGDEVRNCHKCGELFCKRHCQNLIKLNRKGQYDPAKGSWCTCCYKCFSEKPGYNDYGSVRDLTSTFSKLRASKNEDKQLQILQLENRLVRLIDGIAAILRSHEDTLLGNLVVNNQIWKYERTVTSWKDDNNALNCHICGKYFGLTLRKHHCRLCGDIVCDSKSTNCSNRIPISNLVNAADDMSFTEAREELKKQTTSIRICSTCTHNLYYARKFKKDRAQAPSPLLSHCERIQNISHSILNLMTHLTTSLEHLERMRTAGQTPTQTSIDESTKTRTKLIRAVASYTQLARTVAAIVPCNNAEKKIQQSVRIASSIFINEKLVHMKTLSAATSTSADQANKSDDLPVIKPSELVFNNLSIKEVKQFREELMVLKEQKFLVETMMESAKKQRNFDESNTLSSNLQEIESRIMTIQESLGDQGFR